MINASFRRCCSSLSKFLIAKDWSGLADALDTHPLDPAFLTRALWTVSAANEVSLAHSLLSKASSASLPLSEEHYTAVIECALRTGKRTLAANIYYQSQLFGVQLDAALYSELLRGVIKGSAGIKCVQHIFEEMVKANMVPTAPTCASLIKISIKMSDWAFACRILVLMHKSSMELPIKMIEESLKVHRHSEDFEEYKKTWTRIAEMESEENQGNPIDDEEASVPLQVILVPQGSNSEPESEDENRNPE